ncbi:hypothetical protein PR202_ga10308 [Eleusine coracana subsp. coracana]|uniref:Protein kinase domain-containing protein n=1 Tax=Eleusine coracana subsp. coracana TaxID=191504 RepID=A0AAV5C6F5_ELECO|nr:hypothetical protein PR202_ga10308 [Eleusine coracana subsp. coracana]
MSGLRDSSDDPPPRPRGCCRAFASALCKIAKFLLHLGILLVIFILIFLGIGNYSFGTKIILESVSYPAIACLYIYTSSTRKERMISGTFLGVLAVVIVIAAPSAKGRRTSHVPIFVCNFLALLAYCVWRFWALLQACLRRVRSSAAPPLLPVVQQEEAGCSSPVVQHAAFRIEDLPREFSHDELLAVTGDFGSMVGRGGSGEVFHGVLEDGAAVAVKRIIGNMAVGEADFLREISIVANVHHRSLVRLLGYCLLRNGEGQQQYLLVYPFFEHGSLDWWLFHGERRRVAADVARALAYLHHECRRQILHLDIKPANILLDGGLRAHVSDFGISMSIAWDRTSVDTCGRGTPGYMAPEVWASALSAKSDVYSYGVTLLELVAGRRCFEKPAAADLFFPSVVWEKTARGEVMEVADAAMAHVDEGEVEAVVKVALCCVQPRREMRPTMLAVVDMLEGRVPVDLPPESRLSRRQLLSVRGPVDSRHRA